MVLLNSSFCDADSFATWIFNWVAGCFMLALFTIMLSTVWHSKKLAKQQMKDHMHKHVKVLEIFHEIEDLQKKIRTQIEEAKTEEEKSEAMENYKHLEKCLSQLNVRIIKKEG